jgi:hypothetical protein
MIINADDDDCKKMIEIARKIQELNAKEWFNSEREGEDAREEVIELAEKLAIYVGNLLE